MVGFGVGSFGLISLGLGWFESVEGVAGPVTDLGYGALVGIILTMGLLVQLHVPKKVAGVQQAALDSGLADRVGVGRRFAECRGCAAVGACLGILLACTRLEASSSRGAQG